MGAEPVVGQVEPDQASLYRITIGRAGHKTEVVNVLSPVSISNGLAWSSDDKLMYYIDTPTRRVDVFDFDLEKGSIGE
jgi:sugar lactone lactonase YvrE